MATKMPIPTSIAKICCPAIVPHPQAKLGAALTMQIKLQMAIDAAQDLAGSPGCGVAAASGGTSCGGAKGLVGVTADAYC